MSQIAVTTMSFLRRASSSVSIPLAPTPINPSLTEDISDTDDNIFGKTEKVDAVIAESLIKFLLFI